MAKYRREPITAEQFEAIRDHNAALIAGLEGSLAQYRGIPKDNRPHYAERQIAYWRSAIAALKWSTGLAKQRAGLSNVK
jgi:hypothetical protein